MKPSSGHVNLTRYVVESMTTNLLFPTSVSSSRAEVRLILPRMKCTLSKDDFLIPGFRRCQFPIRVCFATTINKAQGQPIPGTLGIELRGAVSPTGNYMSLFPELQTHGMSLFAQPMDQIERKISCFRKCSTLMVMKRGGKVLLFQ